MDKQAITKHLTDIFSPTHIDVVDDSASHASHRGTPHTQNTHFLVTIVSKMFEGQRLIDRHRSVNNALKGAFSGTLHALKITAKTPDEWAK
jgi:BolA protein